MVLSRQSKRTGSSRDCVNVKLVGKNDASSINWKEISWWKQLDNEENVLLLTSSDKISQAVIDAKSKELKNLEDK